MSRPVPRLLPTLLLSLLPAALQFFGWEEARAIPPAGDRAVCTTPEERGCEADYEISADPGAFHGKNPRQHLQLSFDQEGISLSPLGSAQLWEWRLSMETLGGVGSSRSAGRAWPAAQGNRVELMRGRLLETFENTPSGIAYEILIPEDEGSPVLDLDFGVAGNLAARIAEDGQRVEFATGTGARVLSISDLQALDSQGRDVAVRWENPDPAAAPIHLRLIAFAADHSWPLHVSARIVTPKGAAKLASGSMPPAAAALPESTLLAPPGDTCAGAEAIPSAGPFPYLSSLVDATDATSPGDPPPPSCQTNVSHSVWFSFIPQTAGSYSFTLCADAPTGTTVEDTVLAIYSASGSCTGLAEIVGGCSDDGCGPSGLQSSVSDVTLAAGTRYYLVAWSFGMAALPAGGSELQLRVVQNVPTGPPPPNDLCSGAEAIPGFGPFPRLSQVTADISGATATGDPPAPACQANVSRSVWYAFTPSASGRYAFSVCADSPTGTTVDDTVLAVYSASALCSGLVQVSGGCDDDSCAGEAAQSKISGVDLVAGSLYYVVVWSYGTAPLAPGNTAVQLRVASQTAPANDRCDAASSLTLDTPAAGSTLEASNDTRLPSGSSCFAGIGQTASTAGGLDVAYRFTAPFADLYSFRLSGYDASKDAVLYVTSDCPTATPPAQISGCLGAANRSAIAPEEVSCLALAAGQTVFIYVDENTLTSGSAFTLEANRCFQETEPDGTPAQAARLACGVEGSIAPAGDADFFALGTPAADSRLFAVLDGAAGNSTDFDLRVTTAVDTLEYDDLNNDVPFGSVAPNLSGSRLNGAPAYLKVTHFSAAAQAEPYRLYAAIQPAAASAAPETEPNDTLPAANASPKDYFSGALSGAADVDHFSFSAAAGELVQIGLDLDPARDGTPMNGSLALLDAGGATLVLVNDASSSSSSASGAGNLSASSPFAPGEALVYRIRSAGTYYAKVALSSGTPGDYLLSIARNCRISPPTDLEITQSDGTDPVAPGGALNYTLHVRNLGSHPASVVEVRDDFPAGASFLSAVPSQGACFGSTPVICQMGDVAPGASTSISLSALAPAVPGIVVNTVLISSAVADPSSANDTSTESTVVGSLDTDGDGIPDTSDCAPGDPSAWSVPGEATPLVFPSPSDPSLLQWSPPGSTGGVQVLYDLLRSASPGGFSAPSCLAGGTVTTSAHDPSAPSPLLCYLVRSRNGCGGNLGTNSGGIPRQAGSCP